MTKAELRKIALAQKKDYTTDMLAQMSEAIKQTFFETFDLGTINSVHTFLPIVQKKEVDTWLIINELWSTYPDIQVIVPLTDMANLDMKSCVLPANATLQSNAWGIPEPDCLIDFDDNQIDLVIVPLLCFDSRGFRVGYGKGFYDRFLARCKPGVIKVGLSFEPVLPENITDIDGFDIALDYCVTPNQVYIFEP